MHLLTELFCLYLKPLVLEDFLNCHHLLAVDEASLVHHSKGAISYNLYVCVGDFLRTIGSLAGCGYHRRHFAAVSCGLEEKYTWNDWTAVSHQNITKSKTIRKMEIINVNTFSGGKTIQNPFHSWDTPIMQAQKYWTRVWNQFTTLLQTYYC